MTERRHPGSVDGQEPPKLLLDEREHILSSSLNYPLSVFLLDRDSTLLNGPVDGATVRSRECLLSARFLDAKGEGLRLIVPRLSVPVSHRRCASDPEVHEPRSRHQAE